jgi:hypothetical protein
VIAITFMHLLLIQPLMLCCLTVLNASSIAFTDHHKYAHII